MSSTETLEDHGDFQCWNESFCSTYNPSEWGHPLSSLQYLHFGLLTCVCFPLLFAYYSPQTLTVKTGTGMCCVWIFVPSTDKAQIKHMLHHPILKVVSSPPTVQKAQLLILRLTKWRTNWSYKMPFEYRKKKNGHT